MKWEFIFWLGYILWVGVSSCSSVRCFNFNLCWCNSFQHNGSLLIQGHTLCIFFQWYWIPQNCHLNVLRRIWLNLTAPSASDLLFIYSNCILIVLQGLFSCVVFTIKFVCTVIKTIFMTRHIGLDLEMPRQVNYNSQPWVLERKFICRRLPSVVCRE